ncbi:MAG: DUF456 domain-containing protein [Actinobacteria bacterium]|nr:DUF456 domain-containing protein [Actinomycetota bacterium]NBY15812.1 DUF456 domain-containing protein [Actinomycetota bacterium]
MSPIGQVLIGLVMAVGLIGTIIPVFPGITLIWVAGLTWTILDGPDRVHWALFTGMTVFFILGIGISIYLPTKNTTGAQNPKWTFSLASIFAIAGFFLVPVVGLPLGFVIGVFLRHLIDSKEFHRALRVTGKTLKSLGLAALVQCLFGLAMCITWALGLLIVK